MPRAELRRGCAPAVAVAIGLLAASLGTRAQAPTMPPTGAVAGPEPKFADLAGVRTRYYEAGRGQPRVLVHGEGWSGHSSAKTWSKNIPGLSQRFHVFAPDKLASGLTGNPPDDKD